MNNESKLKILLLGPVSSGKTTIANYLSNATENVTGDCRPTKGVRIVEFVAQGLRGKGVYQNSVEVELWDCSGDNRFQSCWPAMRHQADGIVFVYTDATKSQKGDLDALYSFFVEESNFPENCCLTLRNEFGNTRTLETLLPNLNHLKVNLEDESAEFKKSFNSFLSAIIKANSND